MAEVKAHHEKIMVTMGADRKKTKACQETTEAYPERKEARTETG
jgi:hypothetical protein